MWNSLVWKVMPYFPGKSLLTFPGLGRHPCRDHSHNTELSCDLPLIHYVNYRFIVGPPSQTIFIVKTWGLSALLYSRDLAFCLVNNNV